MTPFATKLIEQGARAMFALEHRAIDGWTWEKEAADFGLRQYWLDSSRAALLSLLSALEEPGEEMMKAAADLPITAHVNTMLAVAQLHGSMPLSADEDAPIKQWWSAMLAQLRKEIEG